MSTWPPRKIPGWASAARSVVSPTTGRNIAPNPAGSKLRGNGTAPSITGKRNLKRPKDWHPKGRLHPVPRSGLPPRDSKTLVAGPPVSHRFQALGVLHLPYLLSPRKKRGLAAFHHLNNYHNPCFAANTGRSLPVTLVSNVNSGAKAGLNLWIFTAVLPVWARSCGRLPGRSSSPIII